MLVLRYAGSNLRSAFLLKNKRKELQQMKQAKESPNYMTVADVKNYLNISQAAAYELTRRADFPVSRIGGSIRVPRDAFLAWVELRTRIPRDVAAAMAVA